MSVSKGSGPQVERAASQAGGGARTCATCQRTIADVYYEAGGQVLCNVCKDAAVAQLEAGSRIGRLLSALGLGTVAAAISAAGWYAIMATTGYELGLVAILVGLFVGAAVRVGAKGRGGWLYQTIAVGFTYLAIATSYVPYAVQGFEQAAQEAAAEAEAAAEVETAAADVDTLALDPVDEVADGSAEAEALSPEAQHAAVLAVAVVMAFAWPVLQVTEGGFIGTLIVGFALYEAWKMNRRQGSAALAGPFRVQAGSGVAAL